LHEPSFSRPRVTRGITVAGGDRLGKTIIFAKNQDHANFIADRFDANYPHFKGEFARVITFEITHAQTLIDNFSGKDKLPHIAISVDMLDTGRHPGDCESGLLQTGALQDQVLADGWPRHAPMPRPVRPWTAQTVFLVFDYCQNLEYFSEKSCNNRRRARPVAGQAAIHDALGRHRGVGRTARHRCR
jgi:type I restriction enzyme R subunit